MASTDPVLKTEAPSAAIGGGGGGEWSEMGGDQMLVYRGMKKARKERGCTAKERISKMPPSTAGKRSSIYRGVTRHRWTGRYEAHLWDKSTWNQNQNKKGKQVYLGAYDDEEAAARAYDLAALKYWGPATLINFPVSDYARDLEEMKNVSREEYLAFLRRKSSGFSRGISKYRGLSSGRWDRVSGPEYLGNLNYGRGSDATADSDVLGNFCIDRKIDLTSHIKWWGPNKPHQADSSAKLSEETKLGSEEISGELKTSEWAAQTTEPYQMPRLGLSSHVKKQKGSTVSALNILLRSAAYKSLEEKASKNKEKMNEHDENENKNIIINDSRKAREDAISHDSGACAGLQIQRNMYPSTPFLSAPLLTNYTTIDPLADPVLWPSLVPVLQFEPSHSSEVSKTESSSTYTFYHPDE